MGVGVSGMDMGNQVPSAEGQMVGEGGEMILCLGGTGTLNPKNKVLHTHRQF